MGGASGASAGSCGELYPNGITSPFSCAIALGIIESSSKCPLSTPSAFGRRACPATNPPSAAPITNTGTIFFIYPSILYRAALFILSLEGPPLFTVEGLLQPGYEHHRSLFRHRLRSLKSNLSQKLHLFLQFRFPH